ncbi:MAG: winged helix-turn-helix transcriptional regulator [Candidatus Hydrogenedentes bacterium]|nr:winged helix-turn-helix transcriptional regulator [Candidatus Hydrogenedentota bacterium]
MQATPKLLRINALLVGASGVALAAKHAKTDDASFHVGDLEVFPAQLRARRGDDQIELSLREVKILQLLHARKGQVVDRDTFFNECWGLDFIPNSRTLDQHISKLRKRIERNHKNPAIIQTIHGAGYRFDG